MCLRINIRNSGRQVMTIPCMRPCAVSAWILPSIVSFLRKVSAIPSNVSARLPPTSREIRIPATTMMKSCIGMRFSIFCNAVSKSTPKRCSRSINSNSWLIGGLVSETIDSSATFKPAPARKEPATINKASGSCSSNVRARFFFIYATSSLGANTMATAAANAKTGLLVMR